MDDQTPAPSGQPAPITTNENSGQTSWETERAEMQRQLAELQGREQRLSQQVAGSNKAFQSLKERGYDSIDALLPHLDTLETFKKSGIDPARISQAFKPDEPEPQGGQIPDLEKFKEDLFKEWGQKQTEQTQAQRQASLQEAYAKLSDYAKSNMPDASDRDLNIATALLERDFIKRASDSNISVEQAVKQSWESYKAFMDDQAVNQEVDGIAEIADAVKKPRQSSSITSKGGQGNPTTDKKPGKGLYGVDEAGAIAETARRMAALKGGTTSALS